MFGEKNHLVTARCEEEVGEVEELITLDVLNHYLYKVALMMT